MVRAPTPAPDRGSRVARDHTDDSAEQGESMIRMPNPRARATKSRRPAARTYRPLLEQLEDRSLLNAGQSLLIYGTATMAGPSLLSEPSLLLSAGGSVFVLKKEIETPDHSRILAGAFCDPATARWFFA